MREMKDSGIEWIGEIPKDWTVLPIKYVFNINRGRVISVLHLVENGKYPVYSSQTENDGCFGYLNTYDFEGPAITWTTDGAKAGSVFYRDGRYNCTNVCGILQLKESYNDLNLYFATYAIAVVAQQNKRYDINGFKIMSNEMARIKFAIPNIVEQQQIADYLDSKCSEIDATAEDIQKEISLLEDYKKSVITEAVTKGLNPDAEMKDSGIEWIGEIPKITHILDYTHPYPIGDGDHGTIKAENYSEEGIPFIRVQNLGFATELIMNNVVYITEKQNNGIINSTLYPNDILFAKTGATIGKVGIMPENIKKANTTSHVGKITVSEEVVPKFIFYVLSSFIGYKQFWDIALMKSTRPELSIDDIKTLHVLLPKTIVEQQQIADYLDSKCSEIDTLIADKKRQLDILADYKKSLIYEYVTGKKEVPVNE